jgi:hypothetical protein
LPTELDAIPSAIASYLSLSLALLLFCLMILLMRCLVHMEDSHVLRPGQSLSELLVV